VGGGVKREVKWPNSPGGRETEPSKSEVMSTPRPKKRAGKRTRSRLLWVTTIEALRAEGTKSSLILDYLFRERKFESFHGLRSKREVGSEKCKNKQGLSRKRIGQESCQ